MPHHYFFKQMFQIVQRVSFGRSERSFLLRKTKILDLVISSLSLQSEALVCISRLSWQSQFLAFKLKFDLTKIEVTL